jgi:hypothetical protein
VAGTTPSEPKPDPSQEEVFVDNTPQCVVDLPHFQLYGNVNAFEFQSSFGISFGYNQAGDHTGVGGSVSLKVAKAQMDMVMLGKDPLTRALVTSANVGTDQTKTDINLTIDFSQFQTNPSYYLSTPLAKVSQKALELSLQTFKKQTDKQLWVGRVLKNVKDEYLFINHGGLAGLMVGDQFEVYNVEHVWEGEPCTSNYVASRRSPATPVAIIEISQVNSTNSVAQYVFRSSEHVRKGAEVIIKKLVVSGKETRTLKKKIALGKITAKPFQLPGGALFDMEAVLNSQLMTVLQQTGTYFFEVK